MELEKIKNLSPDELAHQERQANEQLFRLRFQSKMGQTDSTNQLRTLKKDIARIKTIARQRDLGIAEAPVKKSPAKATKRKAAK
ncbi:MAG: 50S ribosomal protein L29 [Acidobacteriaceae bacterium]